jgi:hypothetical protein
MANAAFVKCTCVQVLLHICSAIVRTVKTIQNSINISVQPWWTKQCVHRERLMPLLRNWATAIYRATVSISAQSQWRKHFADIRRMPNATFVKRSGKVILYIRVRSVEIWSRVEAGSTTSTVALLVVGGDGKGTQYLGVWQGYPVPGWYKYGDLALQVEGVSNLRQQNVVMSPAGLGPENDCAGEAQQQV